MNAKRTLRISVVLMIISCCIVIKPTVTHASFSSDVSELITALMRQVENLQKQLGVLKFPSAKETVGTCAYTFTRDLKEGDYGTDVRDLQRFLNGYSEKTIVTYSGAGSRGYESNYFGKATLAAVQRFQAMYDIPETTFGEKTRAKLLSVCGTTIAPISPATSGLQVESTVGTQSANIVLHIVSPYQTANGIPAVDGPVVFGTVAWGDGTTDTVSDLMIVATHTLSHTYRANGDYTIVYTNTQGATMSVGYSVSLSDTVPTSVTSYTLADVATVTTQFVDPIKQAIDDEYTLYTITLKSGQKFEVHVNAMVPREYVYSEFTKTGYTGDVSALMEKAQ